MHGAAVGRQHRRRHFADLPRRAARGLRGPDRAHRAGRISGRVRNPAGTVRLRAPHEHHGRAIVGNRQIAQLDAIVFGELRQPHRVEIRRRRRVYVAPPCSYAVHAMRSAFFADTTCVGYPG